MNCNVDFVETDISTILLLFYQDCSENYEQIAEFICEFMEKRYGAACYMVVSSQIPDVSKNFEYYKKMKVLLEQKFYYENSQIFYMDMEQKQENKSHLPPEYKNRLKEDIYAKKFDALKEDYRRIREYMVNEGGGSYIYMKFICAEMAEKIYEEMNLRESAEMQEILEQIYWVDNVNDLSELVENCIHTFEKFIERKKELQAEKEIRDEIEWVKNYIQSHLNTDLSIDTLAANVYLSPGYLGYTFKKETGINLSNYIKEQRLEKAKELLLERNLKINQICEIVGFSHTAYFCKSFRERYGVSPGKYRKEME